MSAETPRLCCCGRKRITETIIINDYQHELPGHDDKFCGPVIKHEMRDLERDLAAAREQLKEAESQRDGEHALTRALIEGGEKASLAFAEQLAAKDAEITTLRRGIYEAAYEIGDHGIQCKHKNTLYAHCLACEAEKERTRAESAETCCVDWADKWDVAEKAREAAESRVREVEAERDAKVAAAQAQHDAYEAERDGLRGESREMAQEILRIHAADQRPVSNAGYRDTLIRLLALARRHAPDHADEPQSYAPNGMGDEREES